MGSEGAGPRIHAAGTDLLAAIQQTENGGTGLSIDAITSRVGKYPAQKVKQALDHLSGEGHIYSTIDENHFAAV